MFIFGVTQTIIYCHYIDSYTIIINNFQLHNYVQLLLCNYKDSTEIMAQSITITQFYLPIKTIKTSKTIKTIKTVKTIKTIKTTEITETIDRIDN